MNLSSDFLVQDSKENPDEIAQQSGPHARQLPVRSVRQPVDPQQQPGQEKDFVSNVTECWGVSPTPLRCRSKTIRATLNSGYFNLVLRLS